jgi:uncharacterized protein (TIGR02444 family)
MSASADLNLDSALWRFVLPFYSRDGVSAACLALQEELGVDVNILLFAIFAQVECGIVLTESDLAAVDLLVRAWRGEVIHPLRGVRTRMKSGPRPAPSPITEHLRSRIKAAELEAEQIELAMLAKWLDAQARQTSSRADAASVPQMVARYFGKQDAFTPEAEAALERLSGVIRDVTAA